MKPVLGAGLVAVDHIFLARETGRSIKKFDYLASSGGGTVSNILCMLSLLDFPSSIFGITGNDYAERIVKEDFKLFKINDYLSKRGNKNEKINTRQFSHKIYLDGAHKFENACSTCGFKFVKEFQMTEKDVSNKIKKLAYNSDLIIDRANHATLKMAEICKTNNKNKIIFDYGYNIFGSNEKNNLALTSKSNVVKINERIFQKIMGSCDEKGINKWIEKFPSNEFLFITRAEKGVIGFGTIGNKKEFFNSSAIYCHNLKDSSGAGDIFLSVMSSFILKNKEFTDIHEFLHKINISQTLASLNCTLYGARALQRYLVYQNLNSNKIFKISEEILEKGKIEPFIPPTSGLPLDKLKQYLFSTTNLCNSCGNFLPVKITEKEKRKHKIILFSLHKSLIQAPWTMISSYEIGKNQRNNLDDFLKLEPIFIGSGGSYSASIFGEIALLKTLQKLSKTMTPFELESFDKLDENKSIWFISHGGSNTDILGAALWAKKELKIKNGLIITGDKYSKLAQIALANNWKTIHIPSKERNFVSVIGYLSQISVICGMISSGKELEKLNLFFSEPNLILLFNYYSKRMLGLAYEIAQDEKVFENLHLIGLARGWGWPALIDFESKIVEGGICTIEISELKNYTHGRVINSLGSKNRKNKRVIILSTPKDEEFVSFLSTKFRNHIKNYIIKTENEGIVGSLELIIQCLFLAWYLGKIAKKNILRPIFPPEARGLYGWEPSWRKDEWNKRDLFLENKVM